MNPITTETISRYAGQVPASGRIGGGIANPGESFLARLSAMRQEKDAAAATTATHAPIAGSDYGIYANVVVNGRVVASLSNSGCCLMPSGCGGEALVDALDLPGSGPALAQQRAEIIAKEMGGTVEKLSTAQTPEQWAKSGKRAGMIDLWGLEDGEPPDARPPTPQESMDVLLKQQEEVSA
ncbi:MAG: hypothetical protein ACM3Q1_13450 [Bacteroidales bacterium]